MFSASAEGLAELVDKKDLNNGIIYPANFGPIFILFIFDELHLSRPQTYSRRFETYCRASYCTGTKGWSSYKRTTGKLGELRKGATVHANIFRLVRGARKVGYTTLLLYFIKQTNNTKPPVLLIIYFRACTGINYCANITYLQFKF